MSVDAVGSSWAVALASTSSTPSTRTAPPPPPSSTTSGTVSGSGTTRVPGHVEAAAAPLAPRGARVPGHVEAAAEVLGLSVDEVREALVDGASLADLAEEQGVGREDLVAALVEAAPADLQAMDGVEQMVDALVDQEGLGGPAGPPPGGSSGVWGEALTSDQQAGLDELAGALGTDASALLDQLYGGTSLSDLLADAGVRTSDLTAAVSGGLLIDTTA